MNEEEMAQLRLLLGKWIAHLRSSDRTSVLINASEMTYAFVNATCDFMRLPDDPNPPEPEIT